jgi:hypothetical protein
MFTLNTLPPQINPTLVQKLVRAEPATIGHFRDWGFMDPGIEAMQQDVRIAGTAVTVHQPGVDGTIIGYALGQLQAMSATPTVGVVRVPWNDHVYLKCVLDVGAEAVLIPSIDTADEARAAVAACLYPPRGRRGTAASSVRASSYGMAPDYVATCAENLLTSC